MGRLREPQLVSLMLLYTAPFVAKTSPKDMPEKESGGVFLGQLSLPIKSPFVLLCFAAMCVCLNLIVNHPIAFGRFPTDFLGYRWLNLTNPNLLIHLSPGFLGGERRPVSHSCLQLC